MNTVVSRLVRQMRHGSYIHPVKQCLRSRDRVRGVFVDAPLERGGLVMSIPLRYCSFPNGFSNGSVSPAESRGDGAEKNALQLRRANHGRSVLPEVGLWAQRLSADANSDRVSLSSSASAGGGEVATVEVSPIEAALSVSVTLRYFFGPGLGLPLATAARIRGAAVPWSTSHVERLAELYVESLPIAAYLHDGVESLFTSGADGACDVEHECLEQIALNLRDACLTHATAEQYRWMDENPTLFDNILLTTLYVVRSRVVAVPLLSPQGSGSQDLLVSTLAPGLDALNHADGPKATAAAAISPATGSLVVRAVQPLRRHQEITFDYGGGRHRRGHVVSGAGLRSRYLIGDNQRSLHTLVHEADLEGV